MQLAALLSEHEEELRADIQQYYGIDLDDAMAGRHSVHHVMCITSQLPQASRVHRAYDEDAAWTLGDILAASLLNNFRQFVWMMSDRKTRGSEPEPVGPSYIADRRKRSLPARSMPVSDLMKELNEPRR